MAEPNAQILLKFLQRLQATHLFLVGDVFDLWIGAHRHFADAYRPLVDAVRALIVRGVEVHVFEGNHDLYLTEFWSRDVGCLVHRAAAVFALAGLEVRVEHGDLINPDDRGYLFLRRVLRFGAVECLARRLPEKIVGAIGRRASRASRTYTSSRSKRIEPDAIRAMIRAHAAREARAEPFDLLISGHVHVADDWTFEVDGRPCRSVNLGWWRDEARAFLLGDEGGEFVDVL